MKNKTQFFLIIFFLVITGIIVWQKKFKNNLTSRISSDLDISVCDPANKNFSLNSTNPYFPLFPGEANVLEGPTEKVIVTPLAETKIISGVTTRVVEEKEWVNGQIAEISKNYFAEAPDGTVCYFGEDVDVYENGKVANHEGSWLAEGKNKPGIVMPAHPEAGQTYQQEVAAPVATDRAKNVRVDESFETPAGSYSNVLLVEEDPKSTKRYAPAKGLIYDDGAVAVAD